MSVPKYGRKRKQYLLNTWINCQYTSLYFDDIEVTKFEWIRNQFIAELNDEDTSLRKNF